MKKILSIFCLSMIIAFTAHAQSATAESYPYWTISKGVQQLQYKNLQYVPSTVATGNGAWTVSKRAQAINQPQVQKGKLKTGGRPTWFISKGAARQQAEGQK